MPSSPTSWSGKTWCWRTRWPRPRGQLNLMVGATLGGVVAALLGRDAVFVLNALSFVVSAALIWRMRFSEPHAEGGRPFRARELVDFSPILAGIRYVRSQVRLRSTIFVKFGNLIIGPGWVLFTVMGQNEFAVRWRGMSPERGAFLGMSLLLGARGLGALLGPLMAAPWAGHWKHRLEVAIFWGYLGTAAGYALLGVSGHLWQACVCVALAHFGSSIVWVFSTTLLQLQSDDKISRTRLRRRPRPLHVYHCRRSVSRRALCGLGLRRAERSQRLGLGHADSGGVVGVDGAAEPGESGNRALG